MSSLRARDGRTSSFIGRGRLALVAAAGLAVSLGAASRAAAQVDVRWNVGSGGWGTPGNWDLNQVPNNGGQTYNAIIDRAGTYTVTLDINPTLSSFLLNSAGATLAATSRTFTVIGNSTLTSGTLLWQGSTWNGAGTVTSGPGATLEFNFGSAFNSALNNGGAMRVRAIGNSGATLTLGGAFANTGTLELINADGGNARDIVLNFAAAGMTNGVGGVLNVAQGTAGGGRYLRGNLTNQGTVNISFGAQADTANSLISNNGAFNINGGSTLSMQNGADFTQSAGVFSLSAGSNLYLNSGSGLYTQTGGTARFVGASYMTADPSSGYALNGGAFNVTDSTRTDGQIFVRGGSLNFGGIPTVTGGTLGIISRFGSTLTGDIPANVRVWVQAAENSGSTLTATGSLTNNGVLRLENADGGNARDVVFAMPTGTLTNAGTIEVNRGTADGGRYLRSAIVNNGQININFGAISDRADGLVTNNAMVTLNNARLTLANGADFLQAGGTNSLTGDGASLYLNSGSGMFTQTGGTTSFGGASHLIGDPGSTFNLSGGEFNVGASSRTDGQIFVRASALNFGATAPTVAGGSLGIVSRFNSLISGNIPANTRVWVQSAENSAATLTASGSLSNNGVLRLENADGGNARDVVFAMPTGTLTNAGTIEINRGTADGGRYLRATTVNNGTVNVGYAMTFDQAGTLFTNNGAVNLNNAAMTLQNGADFTQAAGGSLNLAANASLHLNSGSGVFTQTGGTTSFAAASNLYSDPGSGYALNGGTIDVANSTRADGQIFVRAASLGFGATAPTITGGTLGIISRFNSTLTGNIPAGVRVWVQSAENAAATLAGAASLSNNGTLRLENADGGNARDVVFVLPSDQTFTNSGMIEINRGTADGGRFLRARTVNDGTMNVAYPLNYDQGNALFTNNAIVNLSNVPMSLQGGADFTQAAGGSLSLTANASLYLNSGSGVFTQTGGITTFAAASNLYADPGSGYAFNGGSIDVANSTRTDGQIFVRAGNVSFGATAPTVTGGTLGIVSRFNSTITGDIPLNTRVWVQAAENAAASLVPTAELVNRGTIRLQNADGGNARDVVWGAAGRLLTNSATGLVEVNQGTAGGGRFLRGNLLNLGTVNINFGTQVDSSNALVTNNGAFNIAGGSSMAMQNGADFTQAGGVLAFTGASSLYLNSGSGVFLQTGGTTVFTGSSNFYSDPGSTFTLNGGAFDVLNSTRTDGQIFVRSSTLTFGGTPTVTGGTLGIISRFTSTLSGDIPAGMRVWVQSSENAAATLTPTQELTSHGILRLENADGGNARDIVWGAAGRLLTNAATGVVEVNQGTAGGGRFLRGNLMNLGTVNVNFGTQVDSSNALVTNNGAFNIAGGSTMSMQNGADFTQAGGTLALTGGSNIYLNSGNGVFTQTGGTTSFAAASYITMDPGSGLALNGGAFDVSLSTRTDGQMFVRSGTLNFGGVPTVTGGTLGILSRFSSTLNGDVPAGVRVWVQAAENAGATLTAGASLTNNGTLRLENSDGGNARDLTFVMPAGQTLINAASGLVEINNGTAGGARVFNARFDNRGAFNVNTGASVGRAGEASVNSGVFAVRNGATANIFGTTFTNQAAGVVTGQGAIGLIANSVNFTNQGTVEASGGGTLTIDSSTRVTNYTNATNTLAGGFWRAMTNSTLSLPGATIINNAADVTLSGPGSVFAAINPIANNSGAFRVLAARDFTTAGAFSTSGILQLGGGTFTASAYNPSTGSETSGFGTLATAPITGNGLFRSNGGTLVLPRISGGSTTELRIDSGSGMNLSGSTGASSTALLTHNGDSLNLGAQNLTVTQDYTNANWGVGNAFNRRANVSGSGQLLATGDVALAFAGGAIGGSTSSPTVTLGNVRVGTARDTTFTIVNTGTNGSSLRGALQTSVNGGSITSNQLSGSGVTDQNFGPLAPGASTSPYTITFNGITPGALTGQNLAITPNLENVSTRTLTIIDSAVFRPAAASTLTTPIAFGNVRLNTPLSQSLPVTNAVPNDGFSESLRAQFTSASGNASGSGVSGLIAPGASSNVLAVGLDTTAVGNRSGTVTFGFESDGAGTSNITPNLTLASQTVSLSATVWRPASASNVSPNPVLQVNTRVGTPLMTALSITNTAANDGFSESLGASFGVPTGAAVVSGSIAALPAGSTNNSSLMVGIDTSTAGPLTGSVTLNLQSVGTGTSGLAPLDLPSQTINIQGSVFRLASASSLPVSPISLGNARVGGTLSQALAVSNTAANDGFSERLNAEFSASTGAATGTGSFTLLNPGASNNSSLIVGLSTATPGLRTGTATVNFLSDGAGTSGVAPPAGLPSQTVALQGSVFRLAAASNLPTTPIDLGNTRVGGTLSQALVVSNTAANDGFSESLNATFAGTTGSATGAGSFTLLAPGASNNSSLVVGLNTSTAGLRTGTATVAFVSDGAGTSGITPVAPLNSQNVDLQGRVYRLAQPSTATTLVNFGTVHVGDTVNIPVGMSNLAANDGFSEGLDASWGTLGARLTGNGSITNLAPGATSNVLSLNVNTATAGPVNSAAPITLASNGAGSSGLATFSLTGQSVLITGQINNYAAPQFALAGGDGVLTQLSPTLYSLDMGVIGPGGPPSLTSTLRLLNVAVGPADTLAGAFAFSGTAFSFTGFTPFNGIAAGQPLDGLRIDFGVLAAGTFSGQIVLSPRSQNDGGFDGALGAVTINITGSAVPTPGTAAVLSLLGLMAGRRRRMA